MVRIGGDGRRATGVSGLFSPARAGRGGGRLSCRRRRPRFASFRPGSIQVPVAFRLITSFSASILLSPRFCAKKRPTPFWLARERFGKVTGHGRSPHHAYLHGGPVCACVR